MATTVNAKRMRITAGLSQREVGILCGCTQAAVSLWEKGRTTESVLFDDIVVAALNRLSSARDNYLAARREVGLPEEMV